MVIMRWLSGNYSEFARRRLVAGRLPHKYASTGGGGPSEGRNSARITVTENVAEAAY
jgi:hypothetical protein